MSEPGAVHVDHLRLAAADRSIALDGTFNRHGLSHVVLALRNLELDALEEVGVTPVAGRVDGVLTLSGPATAPELSGRIGLFVREPGGKTLGRIASDIQWTPTGLRIDASAAHGRHGKLTIAGTLPWRLTLVPADTAASVGFERSGAADTMALAVRSDSFDLSLFRPLLPEQAARHLSGRLAVDAHVGGSPDRPRLPAPSGSATSPSPCPPST